MPRFVLVHSPFVGAVSWRPTADALRNALVADYGGVQGPDWYEGVARRIGSYAGSDSWIAILHSGAGGFAPALAEECRGLVGFVFVDAVLPYPGRTCLENAPAWLQEAMRRLNEGGRLKPWNQWFPDDPLPRLIPDADLRVAFEAQLPRTPFAFLEALSAPSAAWEDLPSGYLQLSKGYDETAEHAEARGWPVLRTPLHHLAIATAPVKVAQAITELAERLRS